jgi:hypothetical protein
MGNNVLEEKMGSGYASVGATEYDNILGGCGGSVLRHLHAKTRPDWAVGYQTNAREPMIYRAAMCAGESALKSADCKMFNISL